MHDAEYNANGWPGWLRFGVVVLATLILCSCSSVPPDRLSSSATAPPVTALATDTLPPTAWTGPTHGLPAAGIEPQFGQHACADCDSSAGLPPGEPVPAMPDLGAGVPWQPPGLRGPWPSDEYIRDGGDFVHPARVTAGWEVQGLEQEETIASYDTLDGRRLVAPSNPVYVYAPRFAAVRRVDYLLLHEGHDRVAGVEKQQRLVSQEDIGIATTAVQPVQPVASRGSKPVEIYRGREQGGGVETIENLSGFHDGFLPYENFDVIRRGIFDQAEKARLAIQAQAAMVWAGDQAVQVVLDGKPAATITVDAKPQLTYRVEEPNSPALRIIKLASTGSARPGETVDFTLRFDNTGDQAIGNVTIIDNLTPRLEYVEGSAQASRAANFSTKANEAGSLILRWEVIDPLPKGEGGLVRFKCRLR